MQLDQPLRVAARAWPTWKERLDLELDLVVDVVDRLADVGRGPLLPKDFSKVLLALSIALSVVFRTGLTMKK